MRFFFHPPLFSSSRPALRGKTGLFYGCQQCLTAVEAAAAAAAAVAAVAVVVEYLVKDKQEPRRRYQP